jgi:hypothetical protein
MEAQVREVVITEVAQGVAQISSISPIPSIVTKSSHTEEVTKVPVAVSKKYNITVMPEAMCDGCQ